MKSSKKVFAFLMACVMTVLMIGPAATSQAATKNASDHIYFIKLYYNKDGENLSKGNATLIESNGEFGLIDAGAKEDTHVTDFLANKLGNGKKLKYLIVSHLDSDHAGNVPAIIDKYCNSNTILCIKDFAGDSTSGTGKRYTKIMNAAKKEGKGLTIYKIKPTKEVTASTSLSNITNAMMTTKFTCYTPNTNYKIGMIDTNTNKTISIYKYNQSEPTSNLLKLGNFTLTLYNGNNWNKVSQVKSRTSEWDENVNSVTVLIERTGYNLTTYSTYLAADLGENSASYGSSTYSLTIAKKAIEAMGKKVSVYQVAHHGYYNSLTADMAKKLGFKYAIVTNKFNDIVNTGKDKFKNSTTWLSKSMDTLTALTGSTNLAKVYFTSGGTVSGTDGIRKYFNAVKGSIQSGTVDVCFNASSMNITQ